MISIDWKATARAGKLMARDFYLERDPPIMLLIDSSSLAVAERTTGSVRKSLIGELAGLLANSQLARSPIGLILYDDRTIITKIEAGPGLENRERILRTFLQRTKHASVTKSSAQRTSLPYCSLSGEAGVIARQLASPGKTEPARGPFALFADAVLPFYRKAWSGYVPRLRKEGVFKAFEAICDLTEPVLVIALSDGKTSWVGLCEGARYAAMLNHWLLSEYFLGQRRIVRVNRCRTSPVEFGWFNVCLRVSGEQLVRRYLQQAGLDSFENRVRRAQAVDGPLPTPRTISYQIGFFS
jgi:hypothetical protein